jgi:hypothetical protein
MEGNLLINQQMTIAQSEHREGLLIDSGKDRKGIEKGCTQQPTRDRFKRLARHVRVILTLFSNLGGINRNKRRSGDSEKED